MEMNINRVMCLLSMIQTLNTTSVGGKVAALSDQSTAIPWILAALGLVQIL